jgi:hypothetical protein
VVTILVSGDEEPPELRLKGVGECSNMAVAPAIANAIANATGQRVVDLPVRLTASPGRHPHDTTTANLMTSGAYSGISAR